MNEVHVCGKLVRFRNAVMPVAVANLGDTLRIVPTQHLMRIRQIDVVPPLTLAPGDPRYSGGGSGVGYPRLSELCFDRAIKPGNFPLNRTLLHEIGHILDHAFNCLSTLTPAHQASLMTIPIPRGARTHGPGECYAIAYQQVMTGGASDPVRAAVLASRAFLGVDTLRL